MVNYILETEPDFKNQQNYFFQDDLKENVSDPKNSIGYDSTARLSK